jgi:hypothetical protein
MLHPIWGANYTSTLAFARASAPVIHTVSGAIDAAESRVRRNMKARREIR